MNSLWLAFLTGLTTGGVSCLAVQGGLLASAVSQKRPDQSSKALVGMFLIAKIIAYGILGLLLGALGSALTITPTVQGWMQIVAGVYMLITAANLLNVHPIFKKFVLRPPKAFYKLARNKSKTGEYFAPAMLGALTVLIPCGITQGMMVLAVASGSAFWAAGIMLAFTLGTTPIFGVLGLSASKLMNRKAFLYIASFVILILGLVSINSGQTLRGSIHTFENYLSVVKPSELSGQVANEVNGKQQAFIEVSYDGYKSDVSTLKAGVPVELTLKTNEVYSCAIAFTIPKLGIRKTLKPTGSETISFTPTQKGRLVYTCSMGMYSGYFDVI